MGPTAAVGLALGEADWNKYGGSVTRRPHPCGRISVTYVAPDGSKLRSWKTCQDYIKAHPRERVTGKPPKSRPKKKVMKSKTEVVEFSEESEEDEIVKGEVTPQKVERIVREQLPTPRRTLLEELFPTADEVITPQPSDVKTAAAEPASTSTGTHGSPKKASKSGRLQQQSEAGLTDVGKVALDNAAKLQKASQKSESGLRDVGIVSPDETAGNVRVLHQEKKEQKCKSKTTQPESSSESESESDFEVTAEEELEGETKRKKRTGDFSGESLGKRKRIKNSAGPSGHTKKEDAAGLRDRCSSDDDGDIIRKNSSSRPKRAAAATNFKEKRIRLDETGAKIEPKKEEEAEDETTMLMMTRSTPEAETPERKVYDFVLHDGEGSLVEIETIATQNSFLAGLCSSREGSLDKNKVVRCELLGPVTAWSIMGYENDCVKIVLSTNYADYYLDKPAPNYRRIYNPLYDQARVCREVYRALSEPDGGDPTMGLGDLELRLVRLYGNMGTSGQFFSRDYFHDIGSFVTGQLYALDESPPEGCQLFSGLRALEELQQVSFGRRARRQMGESCNRLFINGTSHGEANAAAGDCTPESALGDDYELARRLQDEEDGLLETAVDLASSRSARRGAGRLAPATKGKVYVKINENEIANDYPEPAYYKSDEPETDEYVLIGEDVHPDDEHFPHRFLDDWTLYNSESRLVSLELIPMRPCAENDMQIFGSGVITEDDGSGYSNEDDGARKSMEEGSGGIRVFLSAVKEWKVEWGSGMVIISFRTDVSWYRLGTPSKQYVDWYAPVLKTAKIAVKIITMLKEQNRVSRLSFNDVVKKLAEQAKTEPTWISSKQADVERYVMVHGQIILQQIEEFPNQLIQKCAFALGLQMKMEQIRHEKLSVSKRRVMLKKEVNLNPRAKLPSSTVSKKKPMRATTTQLVNRIWSCYFGSGTADGGQPRDDDNGGRDAEIVAEELVEEDSDDDIVEVIQPPVSLSPPKPSTPRYATSAGSRSPKKSLWKSSDSRVKWGDESIKKTQEGYAVYKKALYKDLDLTAGKVVVVAGESVTRRFLIEYLYESEYEGPMIHGRLLIKGEDTFLGDASNERELFLSDACADIRVGRVKDLASVEMRLRNWGYKHRKENAAKDEVDRARAKEREKKGLSIEYFCRTLWTPERGAFFTISIDTLALGSGICAACEKRQEFEKKMELEIYPEGKGFRWGGVDYRINDFLYLDPYALKDSKQDSSVKPSEGVTHKGGRNKGLQAFSICQLLSVESQKTKMKTASSTIIKVRRFYRPEDVDKMKAYRAQLHEVYYSEETSLVEISTVRGKCAVRRKVQDLDTSKGAFDHVFVCDYVHDPKTQTVKHLPANIRLGSSNHHVEAMSSRTTRANRKGKAVVDEGDNELFNNEPEQSPALATLDIFAGCGGLSEGLHQSGVGVTKWAIEYDREAADAFKLNHPSAEVFCDNCNVVLRAIMERGGDLSDCLSPPEAEELCAKMGEEMKAKLPVPGEVDFINGGPPCQGFSGMNRFNQRTWSKVQCEMILSFLSYADYYRPRYFLLENVRNFVSFNKGQTFRLTVASLLEMGYQVRFGVLQAGNFGVSQSRKRAFIWAASPEEILPEWPEPRHVFASSQLGISLPGGGQYSAVNDAGRGAPFRPITVRDTIADLPAVQNGADTQTIVYTTPAESWFQKQIRGSIDVLTDHISKEMNELNQIRCQRIPQTPGADWRDLPDEKVKLSTGQVVDLIPWCLPNTAARHNQWKGLFGRLDWDGNFPTSITDPQPMGKVGMCFHPVQNRIVTVRECARSQGFPDSYKFAGNIICKHRQIGNAVPPPLACALGYRLKEALKGRKES